MAGGRATTMPRLRRCGAQPAAHFRQVHSTARRTSGGPGTVRWSPLLRAMRRRTLGIHARKPVPMPPNSGEIEMATKHETAVAHLNVRSLDPINMEVAIKDFAELHKVLCEFRKDKRWLFRGHADAQWKLLPKAGRPPYCDIEDKSVFESWKRRAIEHIRVMPTSDWEWLAIAQHHGLATRLLDWTTNPLNAAYFAVRESREADAVIYAARFKYRVVTDVVHPMEFLGVATYWPSGVVPRITRQGGVFTIHGKPSVPLEAGPEGLTELKTIVIPHKVRDSLVRELSYYGINAVTLFPDLDGLSAFLNWTIESKEYWNIKIDETAS